MKRILVALDASHRAELVLAAAVRLATLADAKLVLLRAIYMSADLPRDVFATSEIALQDILTNRAHAELERLADKVPAALIETITTELAMPWEGVCRVARERQVDLIVVGSHGYGGAMDHILGTTAAKIVNHADRNVLVVRTLL